MGQGKRSGNSDGYKMEEPRSALCSFVHPASSDCWQSNSDLNIGRERRKREVDKGPWTDACSATYSFTPEPECILTSHRRINLQPASWYHNQERLLNEIW